MAIETFDVDWGEDDRSPESSLVSGVYVDQSLRNPDNYDDVPFHVVEWDGNEVMNLGGAVDEDPVELSGPRADFDDLELLGYGSPLTQVDTDRLYLRKLFGFDEEATIIAKALDAPVDFDLDGVYA